VAAIQWYRKAATQEHVAAHAALGRHYASGLGTAKDNVQAYMWFSLAIILGDKSAVKSQEILVERMSPEQISKARAMTSKRLEEHKKN
jgi:TPR repeat protein